MDDARVNLLEFVDVTATFHPNIHELQEDEQGAEALSLAMLDVDSNGSGVWFGPLYGGTFYADMNTWQWFPDTLPSEAFGSLRVTLGESLTDEVESFYWSNNL